MKAKIKMIIYFILELGISVLLLGLITLLVLKFTLYSESHFKKALDKNNYYSMIYNDAKSEMENTIIPTGLPEEVLENIFTEEMVKNDIDTIITNLYHNKTIKVDTTGIRKNLNTNVNKYLEDNFLEVSDEDNLGALEDQMIDIYVKHVTQANLFKHIQKVIVKTDKLIVIGIITLIAIIAILGIVIKIFIKDNLLSIPLFTSGSLLMVVYFYIHSNININNILIWSKATSNMLHSIANSIFNSMLIVGIICIAIGIIDSVLTYKPVKQKKKSTKK